MKPGNMFPYRPGTMIYTTLLNPSLVAQTWLLTTSRYTTGRRLSTLFFSVVVLVNGVLEKMLFWQLGFPLDEACEWAMVLAAKWLVVLNSLILSVIMFTADILLFRKELFPVWLCVQLVLFSVVWFMPLDAVALPWCKSDKFSDVVGSCKLFKPLFSPVLDWRLSLSLPEIDLSWFNDMMLSILNWLSSDGVKTSPLVIDRYSVSDGWIISFIDDESSRLIFSLP